MWLHGDRVKLSLLPCGPLIKRRIVILLRCRHHFTPRAMTIHTDLQHCAHLHNVSILFHRARDGTLQLVAILGKERCLRRARAHEKRRAGLIFITPAPKHAEHARGKGVNRQLETVWPDSF